MPTKESNSTVLFRKEEKVAILTLNRPQRYNAINDELLRDLSIALDEVKMDDKIRAVVIHGNGKGFCAGADLDPMNLAEPRRVRDKLNNHYGDIVRRLVEMEKPVIAAIHGSAAGAGIGFALACDFRMMADTANIRYAFVNIGLAPDAGASWLLVRTVGYSRALEIAFEGEKIPAEDCHRLGLANKVVPEDQLLEKALDWARRLASRPTLAFKLTKRDLQYAMTHSLMDTFAIEAENQVIALSSSDHKEGVAAFLEKRKPNFQGK